ncbi:MAG: ribonuclease H-like domain-containing protein [Spirochaetia bacterium]
MRSNLSSRLGYMRKLKEKRNEESTSKKHTRRREPRGRVFEDWERRSPLVLKRTVYLPFSKGEAQEQGNPISRGNTIGRKNTYRGFLVPQERLENTLFYDFETTGLSGGAGTYIFLAGVGRISGKNIKVDQLFLEDYPGEPDFLEELQSLIPADDLCVSYNGKRFDRHLLTTRSRMSGVEVNMGPQIDLLYPVRSIWKNALGSCRLSHVEEKILDRGRADDIDGADIPECYFRYLRGEAASCLEKVVEHHLKDIESLAYLLFAIEEAAEDPSLLVRPRAREGMGALLIKHGDEGGIKLLEEELRRGSMGAGKLAALSYRRKKMHADMERVLIKMWEQEKGFFQGEALAKLYEHRRRDIKKALKIVDELHLRSSFLTASKRKELERRRDRLQRKTAATPAEVQERREL